MRLDHETFTMSFAQARDIGIDYRNYQKVDCLPSFVTVTVSTAAEVPASVAEQKSAIWWCALGRDALK